MEYNQPSEIVKDVNFGDNAKNKVVAGVEKLANGFYQTECKHVENETWHDVTRRETIEGAESAIDGSIDHFAKKIEASAGPKVIKTFE